MIKTYSVKAGEIKREWHLIDATDEILGRLSTRIASLLMGKHKATFSRHLDVGDYVVVINAEKIKVTGKKATDKLYYRHTGYPGGLRSIALGKMMEEHPTRAIEYAVKGMIPHNKLGNQIIKKLKVYVGDVQPHVAQTNATAAKMAGEENKEA